MHRSGAAECGNGDHVGVAALFRDVRLGRGGHGFVNQVVDTERSLGNRGVERLGYFLFNGLLGRVKVQGHCAAEKVVRVQIPEGEISVGYRGIFTPQIVARGSRIRPGALWSQPAAAPSC